MERMDKLRRRPDIIRYFYLASTGERVHTGASYWGLACAHKNHGVKDLYLADLFNGKTYQVPMPVERFMEKWREHYNDPLWDYHAEVSKKGASIDG